MAAIPFDSGNKDYQKYLEDLKNDMSTVKCTDCGDGSPNDSMWQYLDNAEQLIQDKYHSDPSLHDKITALREHKYVCLLYTSPRPRDVEESRMPSSA